MTAATAQDWEALARHFANRLVDLWHEGESAEDFANLAEWMMLTDRSYAAWVEQRYEDVAP